MIDNRTGARRYGGSSLSTACPVPLSLMLSLLFSISLVSAQNQVIIEFGEPPGGGCTMDSQCSSNLCVGGTCISCSSNGQCLSNWCDAGTCRACSVDPDCSATTNYCVSGVCTACASDIVCMTGRCSAGVCSPCAGNSDCATSLVGPICNTTIGACIPCASDNQCAAGICSAGRCRTCGPPDNIGCPNNWNCDALSGKCGCRSIGSNCTSNLACCSGACRNNVCASCVTDSECPSGMACSATGSCVSPALPLPGVEGAGVAGPSGSVSQTTYVSSIEVTQEIERKTAAPFITGIFGISRLRTETISTCVRGAPCSSAADCCGAECIDSACLCSKTACVTSGECCEGYCEDGYCRQPPSMSLFLAEVLRRPLNSQVGCIGLIDECDPSEQTCVSICNGLTALLLVVAGGFGLFMARQYNHPIPGLVAGFSVVLIGLITYPFVGIILGIITLGLVLSRP